MTTLTIPDNQPKSASAPVRFFWTQHKDGAEVFCCRRGDGSITEVLSPEEISSAEELIAELRLDAPQ